jgi:hypothetical protein
MKKIKECPENAWLANIEAQSYRHELARERPREQERNCRDRC